MDNKKIAAELVRVARELTAKMDYGEATVAFGDVVKSKLRGFPWKYDKDSKEWVLLGERVVSKFFQKYADNPDEDHAYELTIKIKRVLGRTFEGYSIIFDMDDGFILIGLD